MLIVTRSQNKWKTTTTTTQQYYTLVK